MSHIVSATPTNLVITYWRALEQSHGVRAMSCGIDYPAVTENTMAQAYDVRFFHVGYEPISVAFT